MYSYSFDDLNLKGKPISLEILCMIQGLFVETHMQLLLLQKSKLYSSKKEEFQLENA